MKYEHFLGESIIIVNSLICLFLTITWFSLFGFSLFYDTAPIRQALEIRPAAINLGFFQALRVFIAWSITNIGLMACVSSMLGATAQNLDFLDKISRNKSDTNNQSSDPVNVNFYAGALLRGFIVYLLFLGGLLVFNLNELELTHEFQLPEYIRLAASISLLSFLVGFQKNILAGLLQQAQDGYSGKAPNDEE